MGTWPRRHPGIKMELHLHLLKIRMVQKVRKLIVLYVEVPRYLHYYKAFLIFLNILEIFL